MQTDDWEAFVTPEDETAAARVEHAIVDLCHLRRLTVPQPTARGVEALCRRVRRVLLAEE